ncbi:glycerol-3-phosphate 1-O-acyltransferase PlsY [Catenovulum adriaticum]|uniref:Glycerol-3-phosphate acyltransferase n=1 Tax=Catenovulum adriaticum TaxID=2984846 RepID=A0ABY7AN01_9ALTE|nr:glycerol-3-phosphate 1-O-acyltransferase PlsY [Catenovulum sp. TS8]WAJ70938.1 glycerol-3-phosphate 1-O-acyltransferase PlsY [Catenovulum sp. TS8]
MSIMLFVLLIASYFVGSLSGARIAQRVFHTNDPTQSGSGNPGATNVYRVSGWKPALLTLMFDVFKAVLPLWGSYFLNLPPIELGLVAIACCLGHIFPIYHKFKGGKAVATAFGAMLPIGLELGAILIFTWAVSAYKFKYSSLASLISVSLAPLYVYLLKPKYTIAVTMLSILIILRHLPNIKRLLTGKEPKIHEKRKG